MHRVSTRKVDDLVRALGADTGISKSELSRIRADLDAEVSSFRDRLLAEQTFPCTIFAQPDAEHVHSPLDVIAGHARPPVPAGRGHAARRGRGPAGLHSDPDRPLEEGPGPVARVADRAERPHSACQDAHLSWLSTKRPHRGRRGRSLDVAFHFAGAPPCENRRPPPSASAAPWCSSPGAAMPHGSRPFSVGRGSPGRRVAYTLRHLAELTMATSPDHKEPSVSEILLTVLAEALGAALVALLVAGARRLVGAALA
jgi:hypothetical protein